MCYLSINSHSIARNANIPIIGNMEIMEVVAEEETFRSVNLIMLIEDTLRAV
jgi:hypothetical protein